MSSGSKSSKDIPQIEYPKPVGVGVTRQGNVLGVDLRAFSAARTACKVAKVRIRRCIFQQIGYSIIIGKPKVKTY